MKDEKFKGELKEGMLSTNFQGKMNIS